MKGLSVVAGAERFGILIEEKPGCILTKDWSFRLPLCVCVGSCTDEPALGSIRNLGHKLKKNITRLGTFNTRIDYFGILEPNRSDPFWV